MHEVWFGRYAVGQTNTHTCSLQYFATAPAGEVTRRDTVTLTVKPQYRNYKSISRVTVYAG